MKTAAYLVVSVFVLAGTLYVAPAAGNCMPELARVGEVRAFAVAPGNSQVIAELHHDGWLEARGQLLSARELQALYKVIRRLGPRTVSLRITSPFPIFMLAQNAWPRRMIRSVSWALEIW